MLSRYSLLALGIGVYLAVAIVSFPAATAYRWFDPNGVALADISGTVWRGRAAHGAAHGLSFSNLEWQLQPLALVTGRLSLTAQTDLAAGFARSDVVLTSNRITLSNVSAATELTTFRDLLTLGDIRGQVSLTLDRLEFIDGWPVAASGETRVANLAVPPLLPMPGVGLIPLGNYQLQFVARDEPGISALLNDMGGPLEVTGSVTLSPDRNYLLDTQIRERADAPPVLVQGLDLMVAPNADGWRALEWPGTL